jgi:hypothetical protein
VPRIFFEWQRRRRGADPASTIAPQFVEELDRGRFIDGLGR